MHFFQLTQTSKVNVVIKNKINVNIFYFSLSLALFVNFIFIDLSEIPLCESAVSCDNLPCADNGRLPCSRVVCGVLRPGDDIIWQDYARTEIIENTTNPQFLCTFTFKQSDGFTADTPLRFTVYDVREKMSQTAVPVGYAEVVLGAIQVLSNLEYRKNNNFKIKIVTGCHTFSFAFAVGSW